MRLFSTIRDVARLEDALKVALSRVASLELELKEERARNRTREDVLTDRFLQKQGVFGIAPASPKPPAVQAPPVSALPELNAYEEGILRIYEEDAVKVGRPQDDGSKLFWARKLGQPDPFPLPDDEGQIDWHQS